MEPRLFVLCFQAPSLCLALGVLLCVDAVGVGAGERIPPDASPAMHLAGDGSRDASRGGQPRWIDPKREHLDTARRLTAAALATTGEARVKLALGAADAAHRSLSFGPANAYAWLTLAWAEFAAGNDAAAKAALAASWEWAPHSGNLSFMRLLLALKWWPEADPGERGRIVEEARMARVVHRAAFIDEMQRNPRLWTVWRLIYEVDYPKELRR
ncbi:hypothetical protein M1105_12975 [Limibaculum sp. FT325]|uniref:hypothetical protein n=1 Tax=Thermohalobaculum sediminis TaxID=2939436 RepID=UPI0020BFCC3C|nr:hypothetical protein [Limibaculum sediminis]MCL5777895.1 hypothetical protein [Limibaculum sediminis]